MYTNQLPKHHFEGGSPVISRPVVLASVVALLSCGLAFSQVAAPVSAAGSDFDESQYTDLTAHDKYVTYAIQSRSYSANYQSFTFLIGDTGSRNYLLGNYDETKDYHPLTFYYTVTKTDSTTEVRSTIGTLTSSNASYDAIGQNFAAVTKFQGYADLPIGKGETIDYKSLMMVNIYLVAENKVVAEDGTTTYSYTPDYSTNYILKNPTLKIAAQTNFSLDDFLPTTTLSQVARIGDFSSIHCTYASTMMKEFETLSSAYTEYQAEIESGEYSIRMRFASLTNSRLRINFEDGTSEVRTIRGTTFLNISPSGTFQFLFQNLKNEKVVSLDVTNASLYCDVWDNTKYATLGHSASTWRFGSVRFLAPGSAIAPIANYNLTMTLTLVIFTIFFAGLSFGLFRYMKNRYKNDEFNRVDNKNFLKQALIAFAYFACWTAEILFLIGRCVLFKNSLTLSNPFDPYIVALSVILLIFTGYYIKFLVTRIKDLRIKKRDDALKINDTVADDGTVVTKK